MKPRLPPVARSVSAACQRPPLVLAFIVLSGNSLRNNSIEFIRLAGYSREGFIRDIIYELFCVRSNGIALPCSVGATSNSIYRPIGVSTLRTLPLLCALG